MHLATARFRSFTREPGAVVWAGLFPAGAALTMLYLDSRGQLGPERAAASIGLALCLGNLWGIGWAIAHARMGQLFRQLLLTPAPRWKLLAPFVVQRLAQSLVEGLALAMLASVLLPSGLGASWPLLIFIIALTGLAFSALGILAVSRVRSVESTIGWLNLVSLPFVLGSGLVISLAEMPETLQTFSHVLPIQIFSSMLTADGAGEVFLNGAALALFAALAGTLALWRFRWS